MRKVDSQRIKILSLLLILSLFHFVLAIPNNSPAQILSIKIEVHDIYDNNEQKWLHQFANDYHVKTKKHVILTLLSIKVGDWVTENQLYEAERLLRQQTYLRDAAVTLSSEGTLNVTVIDKWTLIPIFSFSRTGQENSTAIGVKDSNLLGLGIATTLNYKTDSQKSGYRLRVSTPTSFAKHSNVSMTFEDYDIGKQQSLSYEKPFYTSDTDSMFVAHASTDDLYTTYYHNDDELGFLRTDSKQFKLTYGWLEKSIDNTAYRRLLGFSSYSLDLNDFSSVLLTNFYNVRDKTSIWWGAEHYENEFSIFQNIYVISNKEDINLGWHTNYKIGLGKIDFTDITPTLTNFQNMTQSLTFSVEQSDMLELSYSTKVGSKVGEELLIIQQASFNSELYNNARIKNYYTADYQLDLFYPLNQKLTFFTSSHFAYTSQFRKLPQALGEDSGLRGYPITYQYGKKRWLTTIEARYYSDINFWDTLSVGWVAFFDIGKAWDSLEFKNLDQHSLFSVGVGVRIFPKVASGRHVIHVDLARPYSNNLEVDNWEWRVQIKNTF